MLIRWRCALYLCACAHTYVMRSHPPRPDAGPKGSHLPTLCATGWPSLPLRSCNPQMYDAHGDGMGQGKYEVLVDDKLVLSGGAFSGLVERRSFVVQPRTEPECYTRADGSDYRGSAHTTKDGLTCQRWTEHSPHSHSFSSDAYPDAGLGAHNFCRNPDHSSHAWCFTTSAQTERAPCVLQPPQASCTEDVPSAEMLHMEKPIGARAAQGKTPHLLPLLSLTSGMLFVAAAFRSRRKAERVSEMHVDELL